MYRVSLHALIASLFMFFSSTALAQDDESPIVYTPLYREWKGDVGNGPFADDNGIQFHGGPVMGTNPDGSNTPNLYYVWYGDWSGNTALDILPDFASNIGGSLYFNINTSYTDRFGTPVINAVNYGGRAVDFYSQGTTVTSVANVVRGTLDRGDLQVDPNGVYLVLTSADSATSGFCSQYCGWHSWLTYQSNAVKYGYIGNSERCLNRCAPSGNRTSSPNENPGADGMANLIAHELEETVTDPQINAWYDSAGQENADKCAWTFGSTFFEPNGSRANMTLGTRDYLIQRNWVNDSGGYCGLSY